ncbi:MAG: chorismate mutase [Candidatus Gracilibacteria bacterium]|nr:chorismate mutase [Candidatus Gracilibacteria bacterium]
MQELQTYRNQIDEIDTEIIELFAKRLEVVKKVGEYKKIHNIPTLQPARWQEILEKIKKNAGKFGIEEYFIENIWNEIHKESLKLENKIFSK